MNHPTAVLQLEAGDIEVDGETITLSLPGGREISVNKDDPDAAQKLAAAIRQALEELTRLLQQAIADGKSSSEINALVQEYTKFFENLLHSLWDFDLQEALGDDFLCALQPLLLEIFPPNPPEGSAYFDFFGVHGDEDSSRPSTRNSIHIIRNKIVVLAVNVQRGFVTCPE
ncbi:MAG: DUF4230 domain-containing protein [Myxococcales bacterium]|nr:MAG: DUF4230 domain-containing protein [Myxococcales bacterium]